MGFFIALRASFLDEGGGWGRRLKLDDGTLNGLFGEGCTALPPPVGGLRFLVNALRLDGASVVISWSSARFRAGVEILMQVWQTGGGFLTSFCPGGDCPLLDDSCFDWRSGATSPDGPGGSLDDRRDCSGFDAVGAGAAGAFLPVWAVTEEGGACLVHCPPSVLFGGVEWRQPVIRNLLAACACSSA